MSQPSHFDSLVEALKSEYNDALQKAEPADRGLHPIDRLGVLIREHRKQQRLTLQELSDLSDVAYSTLSKLENGDTAVHLRSLNRVLDALGLKLWIA
ncbi:MAG: helix-turn-helix domain-containing protein [Pseudomonadota bacterium]